MRGLQRASLVVLTVALSGCRAFAPGGGGRPPTVTVRPILIVLVDRAGTCQPVRSNNAQHAFQNDIVSWELHNACKDPKTIDIAPNSSSSNPFTSNPPWTTSAPGNGGDNAGQPLTTTINANAALGSYKFDVTVDGKRYDPKLEIDPYK